MDSIYEGDMSFESKKWPIIGQVALIPIATRITSNLSVAICDADISTDLHVSLIYLDSYLSVPFPVPYDGHRLAYLDSVCPLRNWHR